MSSVLPFRPLPLEVRHLRLVVAIVDEGGLTRAGAKLHLTQSALSHQLKQIESSLGVTLFARTRKRLVLTEAGAELVERARAILAEIGELENDLRDRASGRRGTLRIATECYTCYGWLPPLLKRFHRKHPGVDVQIVAEATSAPVDALKEGKIDLAIITKQPRADDAETIALFRDEMLLVVPPAHRLAKKEYVTARDFTGEHLILYAPPQESYFYRNYFGRSPAAPPKVSVIRLTEAIFSMVRAGLGVSVQARWAIADELRSGRLTGVSVGPEGFHREWLAAVRPVHGRALPAYVTDFASLISDNAVPARFAVS